MNIMTIRQKNIVVAILLAAAFVSILNQTLLLIAMPPIMHDFHIDANLAQWLTTVYLLTNGILIPITAFLIGRFSNRILLMSALSLFSIGTLLGALAPSFTVLLIARVIQAAGAGIIMPLMQTALLSMYPKEKRGAVMGLAGLVTGFAPAVGPTLAGWVIAHFTWRHIFYMVFPVAMAVLLLSVLFMKNVTPQKNGHLDSFSIMLSSLGWGGLLYGFSLAGTVGFTNPQVFIPLGVGGVALYVFIKRQLALANPMLEFRVFQSKTFTISTILSSLVYAIMTGTQILLTFYIQNVRGLSALEAGLVLLLGALVMGFMSPVTGKIFDKFGGRGMAIVGFSLIVFSTSLFITIGMTTALWLLALLFTCISLGIAMIMMPLTTAGMNALPTNLMAHGTAMNSTLRMVGGAIVTALLVTVMSTVIGFKEQDVLEVAMLQGIQTAFFTAALLSICGLVLSFFIVQE
ncbi:DHA2 family efflux MFS transporter permease subunit [Lysinibacillus parviboronicapiens]|uniref:DHA2 family efflux MFS transporter permease subunit n=2 Tax=Lysinibacillus parviboronicapiens TaxID=436516 RepID=UPI000D38ACC2|nr:DHA2 family efflux MFS transporter permease subunit [Lysinibacillus parviboronicapiens]